MLGGGKVYGAYFEQGPLKNTPKEVGMGYRNDSTTGLNTQRLRPFFNIIPL